MSERAAENTAIPAVPDHRAVPLADACRYIICVAGRATPIIDKYYTDDLSEIRGLVEEKAINSPMGRRSFWIIDQEMGGRLKLGELP